MWEDLTIPTEPNPLRGRGRIDLQILEMGQENGKPALVMSCHLLLLEGKAGRMGVGQGKGHKSQDQIYESRVNKGGFQNNKASKQDNLR